MSNETSIWDDFGSNSAVITPDANAYDKHEQEMLALNIPARSGDDSFEVQTTDSEGLSAAMGDDKNSDPLGEQDEDSYRINTETGEASEAATDINVRTLKQRAANALGIDSDGLLLSLEELQQKQAQEAAAQGMQSAAQSGGAAMGQGMGENPEAAAQMMQEQM